MDSAPTLDVDIDVDNLLSFDLNTQLDLDDFHLDGSATDVNLDFGTFSVDPVQIVEDDQVLSSLDLDKLKADLSVLTAQSLETSDLPSFELSSVNELMHPHIQSTDSKIGGFDGNNNNNNNDSNISGFLRGSVDADISIDDVLDLTSHDLGLDVPSEPQVKKGPSDSFLPFDISPPSTPTLERSMAMSSQDRSLLENNEYLADLGLTDNGKLFVDDDAFESPLFRKALSNSNSPRPNASENFNVGEILSEENEYDVYDDSMLLHDIKLEDLDDFGEIDKQFFAIRSRSNSMAKVPVAKQSSEASIGNIRTAKPKQENSEATPSQEGSKTQNENNATTQPTPTEAEKALQEKLNQKIQEKLGKIGEEERNRSNSVSAPESIPKTDNVPPAVPRQDRSNSISEGVSVQSGANTVVMEKAAPNIRGPRRLSVGTLQENEKLTSAAPRVDKSPHGSRPTTPSPKAGSREGSGNSSRNNSRPSSRNSDTKAPSGYSAKSPAKTQEKPAPKPAETEPDTQETLDAASKILAQKAKIASPLGAKTVSALKAAPKKSASLPVALTKPRSGSEPSAPDFDPNSTAKTAEDAKTAAPNIKIPAGMKMSFLPPANSSIGSLLKKSKSKENLEEEPKKETPAPQPNTPTLEQQPAEEPQSEEAKPKLPKSAMKPQGSPVTPRRVKFNEKAEMIDKEGEEEEQEKEAPVAQPAASNLRTSPAAKAVAAPPTTPSTPSKPAETSEEPRPPAASNLKTAVSPKATGLAAPKTSALTPPKATAASPAKPESPAAPKTPAAKTTGLAAPKTSGLAAPKSKATASPAKPAEEDDLRASPPPASSPAPAKTPAAKTTGVAAPKASGLAASKTSTPPKSKVASPAPKAVAAQEEDDLTPTPTASPAKTPAAKTTGLAAPKTSGLTPPKSKLSAPSPKATPPAAALVEEEEDDLRPSPPPTTSPAKPPAKTTGLAAPKASGLAAPKSVLTPPKASTPQPAPVEEEEDDLRPTPAPKSPASGLAAPKASGLTPPKSSGLPAPKSGLVAPKKTGIPSPGNKK